MPALASRIRAANRTLIANADLDAVGDYFTAGYVAHGTSRKLKGRGAIRTFIAALRRAFPDLTVEVEVLVENKDRVSWHRTLRGTQKGPYKGFPATGRRIVWRDMIVSRFRDGLIAEEWVITDLAEHLLRARKR